MCLCVCVCSVLPHNRFTPNLSSCGVQKNIPFFLKISRKMLRYGGKIFGLSRFSDWLLRLLLFLFNSTREKWLIFTYKTHLVLFWANKRKEHMALLINFIEEGKNAQMINDHRGKRVSRAVVWCLFDHH